MLARDVFPKIGRKPPVAVHHPMLMSLKYIPSELEGVDRKIAMKMSKSKPETAIFMTDSKKEIEEKFKNAYCPEAQEQDNPIMEYMRLIIFEKFDQIVIERPSKFGGDLTISGYAELKKLYMDKKIHPMDLKNTAAKYIESMVAPVREHFEKNSKAKALYEEVKGYQVTR